MRYTLSPDNYLLRMDIVQNGMHTFLPGNTSSMEFAWNQKLGRNEKGRTFEERNSAVFYKYVGEGPEDLSSSDNKHKSLNGRVRWVAFKNQFFSSVIVAREPFGSADLNSTVIKNDPTTALPQASISTSAPTITQFCRHSTSISMWARISILQGLFLWAGDFSVG